MPYALEHSELDPGYLGAKPVRVAGHRQHAVVSRPGDQRRRGDLIEIRDACAIGAQRFEDLGEDRAAERRAHHLDHVRGRYELTPVHHIAHREAPQKGAFDDRGHDGGKTARELALAGEQAGEPLPLAAVAGPPAPRSECYHAERTAAFGELQYERAAHRVTHEMPAA